MELRLLAFLILAFIAIAAPATEPINTTEFVSTGDSSIVQRGLEHPTGFCSFHLIQWQGCEGKGSTTSKLRHDIYVQRIYNQWHETEKGEEQLKLSTHWDEHVKLYVPGFDDSLYIELFRFDNLKFHYKDIEWTADWTGDQKVPKSGICKTYPWSWDEAITFTCPNDSDHRGREMDCTFSC